MRGFTGGGHRPYLLFPPDLFFVLFCSFLVFLSLWAPWEGTRRPFRVQLLQDGASVSSITRFATICVPAHTRRWQLQEESMHEQYLFLCVRTNRMGAARVLQSFQNCHIKTPWGWREGSASFSGTRVPKPAPRSQNWQVCHWHSLHWWWCRKHNVHHSD